MGTDSILGGGELRRVAVAEGHCDQQHIPQRSTPVRVDHDGVYQQLPQMVSRAESPKTRHAVHRPNPTPYTFVQLELVEREVDLDKNRVWSEALRQMGGSHMPR